MRQRGLSFARRRWPRRSTQIRLCLAVFFVFLVDTLYLVSQLPSAGNGDFGSTPLTDPARRGVASGRNQSVFIASVHRNSAPRLHSTWTNAVIQLADYIGRGNVFISIVEMASADSTVMELTQMRERLESAGVPHNIVMGPTAWELQEQASRDVKTYERRPGWIWIPQVRELGMRWMPVLAKARNQALQPLAELAAKGHKFDSVVWIDDDIVFDMLDVTNLLDTRGGNYAAACAVDFSARLPIQEISALRDDRGRPPSSRYWPWFSSPTSRAAVKAGEPIPVSSCWNGIVAFNPAPFYAEPPLQFRVIADELASQNIEASERCLIHQENKMSEALGGVWMNPNVRVAHSTKNYEKVALNSLPSWYKGVAVAWASRLESWRGRDPATAISRGLRSRLQGWSEPLSNVACLMNDRQVVTRKKDYQWKIEHTG
jgi:hypothetical protein